MNNDMYLRWVLPNEEGKLQIIDLPVSTSSLIEEAKKSLNNLPWYENDLPSSTVPAITEDSYTYIRFSAYDRGKPFTNGASVVVSTEVMFNVNQYITEQRNTLADKYKIQKDDIAVHIDFFY